MLAAEVKERVSTAFFCCVTSKVLLNDLAKESEDLNQVGLARAVPAYEDVQRFQSKRLVTDRLEVENRERFQLPHFEIIVRQATGVRAVRRQVASGRRRFVGLIPASRLRKQCPRSPLAISRSLGER